MMNKFLDKPLVYWIEIKEVLDKWMIKDASELNDVLLYDKKIPRQPSFDEWN